MEINLLKVSDKEKNVKIRWRKKDILHLVRKLIINIRSFMSGKRCKKEDRGEISLRY